MSLVGTETPLTVAIADGPVLPGVDPEMVGTGPNLGLTDADAAARRAKGLGHEVKQQTSRTYSRIVRENLFTFINVTLIGIGVSLIALGRIKDAILSSALAVVNGMIGVIQEIIAKRRLDKIALLTGRHSGCAPGRPDPGRRPFCRRGQDRSRRIVADR